MFVCKLYYYEEYETSIGRTSGDNSFRRYKYEKIKSYFEEKKFKTEFEANEHGQQQMYFDSEIDGYDIEEIK